MLKVHYKYALNVSSLCNRYCLPGCHRDLEGPVRSVHEAQKEMRKGRGAEQRGIQRKQMKSEALDQLVVSSVSKLLQIFYLLLLFPRSVTNKSFLILAIENHCP